MFMDKSVILTLLLAYCNRLSDFLLLRASPVSKVLIDFKLYGYIYCQRIHYFYIVHGCVLGRSTGEGAGEKKKCVGLELSSASISINNSLFDTALYMEML